MAAMTTDQLLDALLREKGPKGDVTRLPLADDYTFVGPPVTLRGRSAFLEYFTRRNTPLEVEVFARSISGEWGTLVCDWIRPDQSPPSRLVVTIRCCAGQICEEYWIYDIRALGVQSLDRLRVMTVDLDAEVGIGDA